MASQLAVAVLAVLAACCTSSSLRQKREAYGQQSYFQCPGDGPFSDPEDCSKFFQCYHDVASHQSCPYGLEFNAEGGYCDFPANVGGNNCNRVSPASAVNIPCQQNGDPHYASFVAHPDYCNAFFSCGNGLLYPECTFCGEGSYFDNKVSHCVSHVGMDVYAQCAGREMVHPKDQEVRRLELSCRPGQNDTFAPLLNKIHNGGGYQGGYQGGNAGGYQGNAGGYQGNAGGYQGGYAEDKGYGEH